MLWVEGQGLSMRGSEKSDDEVRGEMDNDVERDLESGRKDGAANSETEDLRTVVRERYGQAALRVLTDESSHGGGCCGPGSSPAAPGTGRTSTGCCGTDSSLANGEGSQASAGHLGTVGSGGDGKGTGTDPITGDLYPTASVSALPEKALIASLGCGNPTALAELHPGEVVLDLGSGGGIDVLLSARRVGPEGKAYGLDMTQEMLELARRNAVEAGVENVEFLRGEMENIPLPDDSVDVVISNCVINLSADKERVLQEAFRVLKPGGRFAVSDVVVRGRIAPKIRRSLELWVGCVAGALQDDEFRSLLRGVGFEDPSIEPTRVYDPEDARIFLEEAGLDVDALSPSLEGKIMAAFVRARKPVSPQS